MDNNDKLGIAFWSFQLASLGYSVVKNLNKMTHWDFALCGMIWIYTTYGIIYKHHIKHDY